MSAPLALLVSCAAWAATVADRPARGATDADEDPGSPAGPTPIESHAGTDQGPTTEYFRAILERSAVMGVGTAWYYTSVATNRVDWELGWDWESWRRKLVTFDGVRFDTNGFDMNAARHALAGTSYHLIARSNGMGFYQALAFDALASAFWEYFIEYRELVSMNDMVLTPLAGASLGEAAYQLGAFFAASSDHWPYRVVSWLFSPLQALHGWIDGAPPTLATERDALGLPNAPWHRFVAKSGYAATRSASGTWLSSYELGLAGNLVPIPGFGRAGTFSQWSGESVYTRVMFHAAWGQDRLRRFMLGARVAPLVWYAQDLRGSDAGGLFGQGVLLGVGPAYEYSMVQAGEIDDRLAIVHVLGPTAEWLVYAGELRARGALNAYADFALIDSQAHESLAAALERQGIESVLAREGYYFAWGGTLLLELSVSWRALEIGGLFKHSRFASINGLERFQDQLVRDVRLADSQTLLEGWVALRPAWPWPSLEAYTISRNRSGSAAGQRSSFEELVLGLDLQWAF